MSRAPGVNGQCLSIANVGQVRNELEAVDNLTASTATLDTEAQDTAKALLEVSLGRLMVRMALEARVRDPADIGALLEVLSQSQGVLGVSLGAQTESLDTEEQLLGGKGVQGRSEIAQDLHAGTDDEGDVAKGLEELEAVVALRGLVELGEAGGMLAPVELARVDNDTADGGSVTANPLCGRVDDDISAMVDGADEVTTSTKGVVDLRDVSSYCMSWSILVRLTITGTPFSWAALEIASRSGMLYFGFPILST